jgi:16S rRNA G1207 methylase RsmC
MGRLLVDVEVDVCCGVGMLGVSLVLFEMLETTLLTHSEEGIAVLKKK